MSKKRKQLLIFSIDPTVSKKMAQMFSCIIGSFVNIKGFSIKVPSQATTTPDVVIVSGAFMSSEARKRFPGVPVIVPKRIITGQNLEEVVMLPDGTRALVVTAHRIATEETIQGLINLGIQHVKFIPFWEGMQLDISKFDIAITPGMPHLVPPAIPRVIDIGARLISIYSFLNLLDSLGLDLRIVEDYADDYHRRLMASTWKLAEVIERLELRRLEQEIMIEEFEDGVLYVNENRIIKLANQAASRILSQDKVDLLNHPYEQAMEGIEKLRDLISETEDEKRSSDIFTLGEKKIVRSTISVRSDRKQRIITLREIERIQQIEADVRRRLASKGFVAKYDFNDLITSSPAFEAVIEKAKKFSKTGKSILITGESGTGKELFAHAIHQNSLQCKGPFVAINFAGLPESLMESELFGYEEGAFTGASKGGKRGMFEQAHGGTIFLDEIGDASLPLQARLLRVLQENEVMKIGGSEILPVNVRVISATNTDLGQSLVKGSFRKDLYYRLCTFAIEIPPLRARKEDILKILQAYLKKTYNIRKDFSPSALRCLIEYSWPGNVRELINTAEHICFSSENRHQVELTDLPPIFYSYNPPQEQFLGDGADWHHRIAEDLKTAGFSLEVVCCCLKQLPFDPSYGWGRNRIRKALGENEMYLTENKMRRMLSCLQEVGLVSVGSTKQGTLITKKGIRFIDQITTF